VSSVILWWDYSIGFVSIGETWIFSDGVEVYLIYYICVFYVFLSVVKA
jgi:hypothetical protein